MTASPPRRRRLPIRTISACLSIALAAALVEPARAQSVDAEALYQRGRDLLKRGDVTAACEAFAGSLRLEEGVGTMLNLADCREREERLASAWAMFLRAASLASRTGAAPQADEARRRAERLASRLSYLTISVADGSRIEGLHITRDGEPVDESRWNQGIPIDGGRHIVAATAVGTDAIEIAVEVAAAGDEVTAEIPRLKRLHDLIRVEPPPADPAAGPGGPAAPATRPRASSPPRRRMSTLRWIAFGAGATGVVALTGGVVLGLRARREEGLARDRCPTDPCRDPLALAAGDRAERNATFANAALITGGALVASGAVLWLLGAPRDRDAVPGLVPVITPATAAVVVQGRF